MLGALSSTKDVGIYDQALKLINILLTLVTSLGSVMLPRVSNLLSSGNQKAVNKLHEMSFLVYNLVIFPMIAGILIVNNDFVQFFLGQDFQDARYVNRDYGLPDVLYRLDQHHGDSNLNST